MNEESGMDLALSLEMIRTGCIDKNRLVTHSLPMPRESEF